MYAYLSRQDRLCHQARPSQHHHITQGPSFVQYSYITWDQPMRGYRPDQFLLDHGHQSAFIHQSHDFAMLLIQNSGHTMHCRHREDADQYWIQELALINKIDQLQQLQLTDHRDKTHHLDA